MTFNNVIDTLRLACRELSRTYLDEYMQQYRKSSCFYRYLVTDEIAVHLCTLTDLDFADFGEFRSLVREIPSVFWDPRLQNPPPEALAHIRTAQQAFWDQLEAVQPDCPRPDIPYCRRLTGPEASRIAGQSREKWDYVPGTYWYPLTQREVREDRLFLMAAYVQDHWAQIERLLGLPEARLYCLAEKDYPGMANCAEVAQLPDYGGLESACCDREFTWIIYFSHEETVTFAGAILPEIQKILAPEREHWNRWEQTPDEL